MNSTQRKFIFVLVLIYLLTLGIAWMLRAQFVDLHDLNIFLHLFARYDFTAVFLLLGILGVGIIYANGETYIFGDRWIQLVEKNIRWIILFIFLILLLGAYFIYHHYPLCMDEYLPYFQARIFAAGKLWGQFPPELIPWLLKPNFFSIFSPETGSVISGYWPGFSLLLTPFMKLGVPWLLNPAIGAGSLLLLFYYSKKVFDSSVAASWAVLLTISSSVFLVNNISFYSMSAHLFLNLLFAVCLLKVTPVRLLLAGLVGSLALVLHNPVPHAAFVLPRTMRNSQQKERPNFETDSFDWLSK